MLDPLSLRIETVKPFQISYNGKLTSDTSRPRDNAGTLRIGAQLVPMGALTKMYGNWVGKFQEYHDRFDPAAVKLCIVLETVPRRWKKSQFNQIPRALFVQDKCLN